MQKTAKILVGVLFLFGSYLPMFFHLQQTFAQPDESVKLLITDAIEDLQNNDTNTALTHSHLASQKLSSEGISSSDSRLVLINDAIQDLLNNDTDTAIIHLGLVNEQLELPSEGVTTSAVSLNKTSSLNTTLTEKQKENVTITLGKDECTDNNLNGICGLDKPISPAHVCFDVNHDFNCDWFRRPVGNGSVWANSTDAARPPVPVQQQQHQPLFNPGTAIGSDYVCYNNAYDDGRNLTYNVTESKACQRPGYADYYFGGFKDGCMARGNTDEYCIDYVNRIDTEQRMTSAGETSNLVCQTDDDFCQPGCELEDMQCIDESKGSGSNIEEYCEDLNDDGFCDITHLSDGSTIVEDQEEIERLKRGNDGSPDTQQQQQQPSGSISVPLQPQQNRVNWGAICRNPIVDSFLSEPCETLTSPDGFTLTSRGHRVLACLGVGGIATFLAPEILASVKSLGPAVGCGSNTGGESSPLGHDNPLDTMLGDFFRK